LWRRCEKILLPRVQLRQLQRQPQTALVRVPHGVLAGGPKGPLPVRRRGGISSGGIMGRDCHPPSRNVPRVPRVGDQNHVGGNVTTYFCRECDREFHAPEAYDWSEILPSHWYVSHMKSRDELWLLEEWCPCGKLVSTCGDPEIAVLKHVATCPLYRE